MGRFIEARHNNQSFTVDSQQQRRNTNDTILQDLMAVGVLKARGIPRTDASITNLDRKTFLQIRTTLQENNDPQFTKNVNRYQRVLKDYIEGKNSIKPLRAFIAETFQPTATGKERFLKDIQEQGPGLIIATHNTHTPEIDVIDWENGAIIHDVGPITTRIGLDIALEGSDITVTRLVKSPHASDFYNRAMQDLGNVLLSDEGTDMVAKQVMDIAEKGQVPALLPEGGFRVLDRWSTSSIVLAVKAGLPHLHLVAQSPMVSLLDPNMSFDYIGMKEIPPAIATAVRQGDKEAITQFSQEIRSDFAAAIQKLPYPEPYKTHVAQYTKK